MINILIIFLISMVPVVELRGALPMAYFKYGMEWWEAFGLSAIGNLIPVPFLLLFGNKVLHFFADEERFGKFSKPFRAIIRIGEKKISKLNQSALFIGLMLFVGVPLPGTGAWTGCLIAMLLQLPMKKAVPPIIAGVLMSGTIVTLLCVFAEGFAKSFLGVS